MNMQNTSKVRALTAASISGVAAFIAWLAAMPPEQQTSLLAPFVEIMPLAWRDAIGLAMRLLASASGIYASFQAAKSGPATDPSNPVNE